MSRVSIYTIKNIIRILLQESREIKFGPTIKVDRLDVSEKEITVTGKYESLSEDGVFTIILDKNYNVIKFEVKPRS